jgi:putative transposase
MVETKRQAGGVMAERVRRGYETDLTDAQWAVLAPLLRPPAERRGPGRPMEVDLRRVVDALLYMNRTGCQWRLVPSDFPAWWTVRYYFDKWQRDGTWERINDALRRQVRVQAGRAPEPTAGIIDSRSVKTTEVGGERGFDAGKKNQRAQGPHYHRHRGEPAAGVVASGESARR